LAIPDHAGFVQAAGMGLELNSSNTKIP